MLVFVKKNAKNQPMIVEKVATTKEIKRLFRRSKKVLCLKISP
jgi:hypothetical protein